jgi:hypothetical protein
MPGNGTIRKMKSDTMKSCSGRQMPTEMNPALGRVMTGNWKGLKKTSDGFVMKPLKEPSGAESREQPGGQPRERPLELGKEEETISENGRKMVVESPNQGLSANLNKNQFFFL